ASRRLEAGCVRPGGLAEMVGRWAAAGLLPPEARHLDQAWIAGLLRPPGGTGAALALPQVKAMLVQRGGAHLFRLPEIDYRRAEAGSAGEPAPAPDAQAAEDAREVRAFREHGGFAAAGPSADVPASFSARATPERLDAYVRARAGQGRPSE